MSIIAGGPRAADGSPVVSPAATAYSKDVTRFVGARFVCRPGVTENDLFIVEPVQLQAWSYWVEGANNGDIMALSVADEKGGDIVRYVQDLPVAPWPHQYDLSVCTTAPVPAKTILRVSYSNVGEKEVTLGVLYKWLQPPVNG